MSGDSAIEPLNIYWNLTDICNFKCSYCPITPGSDSTIYTKGRLLEIADKIIRLPQQDIYLSLIGGEVTLHPFLSDIIRYIIFNRKNIQIILHTNGSMGHDFFQHLLAGLPPATVKLSLAIHPETAGADLSMDIISVFNRHNQPVLLRCFCLEAVFTPV